METTIEALNLSKYGGVLTGDGDDQKVVIGLKSFQNMLDDYKLKLLYERSKKEEVIPQDILDIALNLTPGKIKTFRTVRLKVSQKVFGNQIGYSEGMIRHVEKGRKPIKFRMALSIARLISHAELL